MIGTTPRFEPRMWNSRGVTEINLPRTTNSVESWHHQLQRSLNGLAHPNFFTFLGIIPKLKKNLIIIFYSEGYLQENLRANAVCIKLDAGQELPLYTRKEYRLANERLLNLIGRYDETFPDDYLTNCCNYVYF